MPDVFFLKGRFNIFINLRKNVGYVKEKLNTEISVTGVRKNCSVLTL